MNCNYRLKNWGKTPDGMVADNACFRSGVWSGGGRGGWSERDGSKDWNERTQGFDRDWATGALGLAASKRLLKSLSCCNDLL